MYQIVVIGLGFSLVFGAGYYITKVDSSGVIEQSLVARDVAQPPTTESLAGDYLCEASSGCDYPYELVLSADGKASLTVSYSDRLETKTEKGVWNLERGGIVTTTLTESVTTGAYESAHTFLIQAITATSLSKIAYDKSTYTDMHKPTFQRQGE
jgi:hypothetical protein